MRIFLLALTFFFAMPAFSQTIYGDSLDSESTKPEIAVRFKDSERANLMKQNIKTMRGSIGSSQNAIKARNLLMLKEVLDFKMQDETLKPEIAKLRENREFNNKLLNALNQLDNKKSRNRKNQEIINILNDAGNRIYNSLAN